jgi:hypothetical protein
MDTNMKMTDYMKNRMLLEGAYNVLRDVQVRVLVDRVHGKRVSLRLQVCDVKSGVVLIEGPPVEATEHSSVTWSDLHDAFTFKFN